MGLMKLFLFAALIVVALYLFAPPQYQTVKNTATDLWHSIWDKVGSAAPPANTTNTTGATSYQSALAPDLGPAEAPAPVAVTNTSPNASNTSNESLTTPSPVADTPACARVHHGFPDYAGTQKVGDTCLDVPVNRDDECIANPPTNYDGEVNPTLHYSNPALACCEEDGQCHWN